MIPAMFGSILQGSFRGDFLNSNQKLEAQVSLCRYLNKLIKESLHDELSTEEGNLGCRLGSSETRIFILKFNQILLQIV